MNLPEQRALLDDLKTERIWCLQHGMEALRRRHDYPTACRLVNEQVGQLNRQIKRTEANIVYLNSGLTRSQLVDIGTQA